MPPLFARQFRVGLGHSQIGLGSQMDGKRIVTASLEAELLPRPDDKVVTLPGR